MKYFKIRIYREIQRGRMEYFVKEMALGYKILGYVKNLLDKTVKFLLIGDGY